MLLWLAASPECTCTRLHPEQPSPAAPQPSRRRLAAAALLAERERLAAVLPADQERLHLWAGTRRRLPHQQVGGMPASAGCAGCASMAWLGLPGSSSAPGPPSLTNTRVLSKECWPRIPAPSNLPQAAQRAPHAHQVERPGLCSHSAGQRGPVFWPPDAAQLHSLHEQRDA